jgi:hypothetical protein
VFCLPLKKVEEKMTGMRDEKERKMKKVTETE